MSPKKRKSRKNDKLVVICISGMAGSGKSTLARRLAEKYGLRYFSGGDALKALAYEEGYGAHERGWWESEEGLRFLQERGANPAFDEVIDKELVKLAHGGNVILDSWTMPWLLKCGFKMWLEASPEKRAKRIAERDRITFEEALRALRQKEKKTRDIYKRLYGFALGEDFTPFNLILDTDSLNAEEVFQVLRNVMDNLVLKREDH
jgi:cytidylate kinase